MVKKSLQYLGYSNLAALDLIFRDRFLKNNSGNAEFERRRRQDVGRGAPHRTRDLGGATVRSVPLPRIVFFNFES